MAGQRLNGPAQGAAAIDVLIPVYNAETTLVAAIRSIQQQTVGDIRLIVVNDGSTDSSGPLLHEIAAHDPRVLLLETPNRGIVTALNLALQHATAPIVARHDADDLAFPHRFDRQLAYLQNHSDCIAVSANAYHIDGQGRRTGSVTGFEGDATGNAEAVPGEGPYLMHPFLMLRREALAAAGGYRYVLQAEETDLYWRLLGQGRLYTLPEILGEYRVHEGGVSNGSVHNARIGSVYSELGAISYLRRRHGRQDLDFPARALAETRRIGSIEELLRYVEPQLTGAEAKRLRFSAAVKLLESGWRPYVLEAADCAFIAGEAPRFTQLDERRQAELKRHRAIVLWRLLLARRMEAVRALNPWPGDYLRLFRAAASQLKSTTRRLAARHRSYPSPDDG